MTIDRRRFLQLGSSSAALSLLPSTFAETAQRPPIIDVHLHAYPLDAPIPAATNPATGKTIHLKDGAAHRAACLTEMKRLNIVKAVEEMATASPPPRHGTTPIPAGLFPAQAYAAPKILPCPSSVCFGAPSPTDECVSSVK